MCLIKHTHLMLPFACHPSDDTILNKTSGFLSFFYIYSFCRFRSAEIVKKMLFFLTTDKKPVLFIKFNSLQIIYLWTIYFYFSFDVMVNYYLWVTRFIQIEHNVFEKDVKYNAYFQISIILIELNIVIKIILLVSQTLWT